MHVSGLVAVKKDNSWCYISVKNGSVLGIAVWQRGEGDDPCASPPLLFSAQRIRIMLHWLDG